MTNASFSVRPRMNAIGAISIVPRSMQPLGALDLDHVVERVVQRPQVRVHLLLQIARQESQLLAGFDRRPREDDAAHALRQQKRHGLRHRQVRLAGAGRSDAEDDVVLLDRVEIAPLVDGLRRDAPLARLRLRALEKVLAEIDVGIAARSAARRFSRRRSRRCSLPGRARRAA